MRIAIALAMGLCTACGGTASPTTASPDELSRSEEEPLIDYDPESLVRFELVADVQSLQVGTPATLGALFHIQEGWHIY